MNTFFITGLPRCRSAWSATYMTYPQSFCLHDGFLGLNEVDDFPIKMDSIAKHVSRVGNSDPANVLYWERLNEWFPDATWVVIERPFEEVIMSCNRINPTSESKLWDMAGKLSDLIENLNPLVIDFHAITPELAMKVAEHCGVDAGPLRRAEQMCRMNIQIESSLFKAELKRELHYAGHD